MISRVAASCATRYIRPGAPIATADHLLLRFAGGRWRALLATEAPPPDDD